jgi:hypothetical protein
MALKHPPTDTSPTLIIRGEIMNIKQTLSLALLAMLSLGTVSVEAAPRPNNVAAIQKAAILAKMKADIKANPAKTKDIVAAAVKANPTIVKDLVTAAIATNKDATKDIVSAAIANNKDATKDIVTAAIASNKDATKDIVTAAVTANPGARNDITQAAIAVNPDAQVDINQAASNATNATNPVESDDHVASVLPAGTQQDIPGTANNPQQQTQNVIAGVDNGQISPQLGQDIINNIEQQSGQQQASPN